MTAFGLQRQGQAVVTQTSGLQSQKYIFCGPLQKQFASLLTSALDAWPLPRGHFDRGVLCI